MTGAENKNQENAVGVAEQDRVVETHHSVTIAGREVSYTAMAGTLILREEDDEKGETNQAKAAIFFVAYTLEAEAPENRPVTFAFNGGPGSSSVWLHLGLLGPRRVRMADEPQPVPPPYELLDNEYSLLDQTDLVFIDPVSTGFSRTVAGEKPKQYHDFKRDLQSVGDFIRLWISRYRRWASPKFLAGESYGTTRAAALAGYLQNRHGIYLNGILLISSILDFQTAHLTVGNDLPFILFLPTFAATAWYHRRLEPALQADLTQTLAEVEEFALGDYALALLKGSDLPTHERASIIERLARYTALSPAYLSHTNLRINIHRFVKELLRERQRTVGRLDSRYSGIDRDAAGELAEYDPSYAAILGPYSALLNHYVRGELNFESDLPYEILTDRVQPWNYDQFQNQYVNVAETLRSAMSQNPHLRVLVANGYYDLATPYLATRYTFSHLGLDTALKKNITMTYYEAGHMMYIHTPSLAALRVDMAAFIQGTTEGELAG